MRQHARKLFRAVLVVVVFSLSLSPAARHAQAELSPISALQDSVQSTSSDTKSSPISQLMQEVGGAASDTSEGTTAKGPELPDSTAMTKAAENERLLLQADTATGHFIIKDKRNGSVWNSFPDPKEWANEPSQGQWRTNMTSPFMLEYVDPKQKNDKPRSTNFYEQQGTVSRFKLIEQGFELNYELEKLSISFKIQVKLNGDSVETTLLSDSIVESKYLLTSVMLFPFFGAYQSTGQDGYLLVPDGSGALIRFRDNRQRSNYNYETDIYGVDWAVKNTNYAGTRAQTMMPVYGIKSGDHAMLALLEQGDAYAGIKASPSGNLTQYNWASFKLVYRDSYWQPTTSNPRLMKTQGYLVYPKQFNGGDRTIRYFLLDQGKTDYAGMADRYRTYLMEEKSFQKTEASADIPLYVDLLGADAEKGFFTDRYRKVTDFNQAKEMLEQLKTLGVHSLAVRYIGWQKGGYSVFGKNDKVDSAIGGNDGLADFTAYAHKNNIPVYLFGIYEWNNTSGFSARNYGMVDQGNSIIEFNDRLRDSSSVFVSPKHAAEQVLKLLDRYKKLGVDGVSFNTIGQFLNSDYNSGYELNRSDAMQLQIELLEKTRAALGKVSGNGTNIYGAKEVDHIYDMPSDYSYDAFSDEAVPFAEMVLHGLVSYSFSPANQTDQFQRDYLRSIEYGATPHFVFGAAPTEKLKKTFSFSSYWSTNLQDWEDVVSDQYAKYNEALGDVQNQFIVSHRSLQEDVKEVVYSNGKRIIVNYSDLPYREGKIVVAAHDFAAIGGDGR